VKRRNDPLPMTAADLRRARVELGLRHRDMADRMRVDIEHYLAMERGRPILGHYSARLGLVRIAELLRDNRQPLAEQIKAIVKESLVT
jgi:hypothetical protein